jgi:hypothetical protein
MDKLGTHQVVVSMYFLSSNNRSFPIEPLLLVKKTKDTDWKSSKLECCRVLKDGFDVRIVITRLGPLKIYKKANDLYLMFVR